MILLVAAAPLRCAFIEARVISLAFNGVSLHSWSHSQYLSGRELDCWKDSEIVSASTAGADCGLTLVSPGLAVASGLPPLAISGLTGSCCWITIRSFAVAVGGRQPSVTRYCHG